MYTAEATWMLLCTDHSLSTEALEYSYKEILSVNFKVCYNRILEFETIQVNTLLLMEKLKS